MSAELTVKDLFLDFCKEWLRQSELKEVEATYSYLQYGLCFNILEYIYKNPIYSSIENYKVSMFLEELFESKGLCTEFPFNYGYIDFVIESKALKMLSNPLRKQFVLDYIKENS